jgi:hypothetical protein
MKQRVRIKQVQRRQALGRSAREPAAETKGYVAHDYRSRLATIYSEHKELFKRLEDA